MLTAYNGQPITYDAQGNPTTYLGHTLAWEKGRQLKSFDNIAYTYNANGIRTSKTVGGVKHTYALDGTKILCEKWDNNTVVPLYDNEDGVCGIVYNDEPYYFQKNLQGDIIGIMDKDAHSVAKYSYDAWGVCTVTQDASDIAIATVNPYRYRGYYYDPEIGMYYLQSRYYNPVVGRFVNGDSAEMTLLSNSVLEKNLFSYCNNNAVKKSDPTGYSTAVNRFGSMAVFVAVCLIIMSIGGVAASNPVGWVLLGIVVVGLVGLCVWQIVVYIKSRPKSPNLPAFKKLTIDMDHIMSGHSPGGGRNPKGNKSVFYGMTAEAVRRAIEEAYKVCEKIKTQGDRVLVRGFSKTYNLIIEMWLNIKEKVIETAYPK